MYTWSSLLFQDSCSPIMESMIFFHDTSMLFVMMITAAVIYIFISISINKFTNRLLLQGHLLEMIWTLIPMLILMFLIIPSLKILYLMEEMLIPSMTIKTTGHQWYWDYEYPEFKNLKFSSFMIQEEEEKNINHFRLLDVSNRTVIPFNIPMRILVTSEDVIHSWTVPSLGIKMDATPGRINQVSTLINRPGQFFGQCSEICGLNHSFMPINIEATSTELFSKWIISSLMN